MRSRVVAMLALIGTAPAGLVAQISEPPAGTKHLAVEATILTLDHARLSRLGPDGLNISTGDRGAGVSTGHHSGTVRVGTRVGGLELSAFLDLVRNERAVRRESTQRIVTLSGSAAEVSSQRAFTSAYGHAASAGPALWVEPVALEDGQVRLRVWAATGELRPGPFGSVWEDVPVEARTEITVPSGTPVVIATTERSLERIDRELLGRGSTAAATQGWIVVRTRIIADASRAFEIPEGLPKEWLKR